MEIELERVVTELERAAIAELARDHAIQALGEEGRRRGQTEAERDRWRDLAGELVRIVAIELWASGSETALRVLGRMREAIDRCVQSGGGGCA